MPATKSKHNYLLKLFSRNFFLLSFLFLILEKTKFLTIGIYISINFLIALTIFFAFSWLFFSIKKDEEKYKPKFEPVFKHLFLLGLLLITIGGLNFDFIKENEALNSIVSFISSINFYLSFLTIGFGFFTFYLNRSVIASEAKQSQKEEELAEKKRNQEFPEKYPGINKIPILRNFVRWMYKEGVICVIGLLLILTMFTAIKAPYFDISFTGEHTMKYNTHVEPAKYMYERNNPFWMQRKYQADPVDNPEGVFTSFGNPPLMEWGLLSTYKLFPKNSLEFNTRLFTHFLGILILFFAYLFFREWFSKTQSLLIIFLIAINPIISFVSFVTVLDSWLLIFTFLSLFFLSKYIKEKNIVNLFYTGLFFGIGVAIKMSIFLWLLPIIFIILVFNNKNLIQFIKNIGIISILSLMPLIAHRTSLRNLPTEILPSLLKFVLWIGIFILIYHLLKKYHRKIDNFIDFFLKRKLLISTGIIILVIFAFIFLNFTGLSKLSNEFLTDSTLIFNWDMYDYVLNNQFKPYMTENVYYLGLIGFLFILFSLREFKKQKIILFSFLAGSLVYWILASKPMFFHNYYTGIIMTTFAISVGTMFYILSKTFKNRFAFFGLILLLGLLVFPASYDANVKRLSKESNVEPLKQVAQFLIENTKEDEIYIDTDYHQYLTILSNRPQTRDYRFDREEIKDSIQNIGFKNTMEKYNISYLITRGSNPQYERFISLFADEELTTIKYKRSQIIINKLGQIDSVFIDIEKRNYLVEKYNIKDKFFLEKEIGPFRVFGFKN